MKDSKYSETLLGDNVPHILCINNLRIILVSQEVANITLYSTVEFYC